MRLWELPSGRYQTELPHDYYVRGLCFSASGRYLAVWTEHAYDEPGSREVYVWDLETWRLRCRGTAE